MILKLSLSMPMRMSVKLLTCDIRVTLTLPYKYCTTKYFLVMKELICIIQGCSESLSEICNLFCKQVKRIKIPCEFQLDFSDFQQLHFTVTPRVLHTATI